MKQLCIAIIGPTASGKTRFSIQLAQTFNGEIVCMDSATVYRGLDIGSAKPTAEEQQKVPHHLIDILNPDEPFSAFHFVQKADETIRDIRSRGKLPIVVGGTYFYLRALQHGMYPMTFIPAEMIEALEKEYMDEDALNAHRLHQDLAAKDPKTAANIHPNDRYRLLRAMAILRSTQKLPSELKPEPISEDQTSRVWLKYAMTLSRNQLNQNILRRTDSILSKGLIAETQGLLEKYPAARCLQSIGYLEATQFLQKKLTEKQVGTEIVEKTRQLAKRQMTWLRSDPEIRFIDNGDMDRVKLDVENLTFAMGKA